MKNIFVLSVALSLLFSTLSGCRYHCVIDWEYPASQLIRFNKSTGYELYKNGIELDIHLDISSDITDDAFLVVYAVKEYPTAKFEGFKDSLKIEGFHIRSYHIPNGYLAEEVLTPVDYPVYIKKTFIKKGKNIEKFKISFPKNIASIKGEVVISAGLVRYNDEINRRFAGGNPPPSARRGGINFERLMFENYRKLFFETFPDSSKTALIFSDMGSLFGFSILENGEAPEISVGSCSEKQKPPTYSNFDRLIIQLKSINYQKSN